MTELEKEIQELRRENAAVKTRLRTVMDYLKNDVCEMSGTDYCDGYCSLKCWGDMTMADAETGGRCENADHNAVRDVRRHYQGQV